MIILLLLFSQLYPEVEAEALSTMLERLLEFWSITSRYYPLDRV
jgi:hypothetical protein